MLCGQKKSSRYILNRRLGGTQNSYESFGELKSDLFRHQSNLDSLVVHSLVKKLTELSHLHYLHASTADVSVTIDCLTCSLVLPPHSPPANTAQFGPELMHFRSDFVKITNYTRESRKDYVVVLWNIIIIILQVCRKQTWTSTNAVTWWVEMMQKYILFLSISFWSSSNLGQVGKRTSLLVFLTWQETGDNMAMKNVFVRLEVLEAVIAYMVIYMVSCNLPRL